MASKKKNDSVQEVVVSAKRPTTSLKRLKKKLDRTSDAYSKWQEENPGTKLTVDSLPGSGFATGIADMLNDTYRGNYTNIPIDAISIIPGGRLVSKAVTAGVDAVRNSQPVIDAIRSLPLDHYMTRTNEAAARLLGGVQDTFQAKDQYDKNREEKKYAEGGDVKKKFEGLEVAVTAPRMGRLEQGLYDENQKPEAQRRQEAMDIAMGFASPGPAIAGAGLKALARNAAPEFSAGRREFLGNTGKIAAAAAVPNVLKGAAPVVEQAAPAAVKPVQKTVKQLYEEMYEKGVVGKEQQQAYMQAHMDAGKVAPLRNKDRAILNIIFGDGKYQTLARDMATGGSVTMPNNYRAGGRVRMI